MLGKIYIVGLGPGDPNMFLNPAINAIKEADVVIGYKYYFQFIQTFLQEGTECLDTGMKQETQRAEIAFEYAEQGKKVAVISSGDAGIYGMAPLIYEMAEKRESNVEIELIPGISAFQAAAAKLGAPIGHDTVILSLSDLLTPWELIERRIKAAAYGDFVTVLYNPKSKGRYWQIYRLQEIFLEERSPDTPVAIVRQVGRAEENIELSTLAEVDLEKVDMFCLVVIGNSQSYISKNKKFITPRGYYSKYSEKGKPGPLIMQKSFATIAEELKDKDIPLETKWALLHLIHTSADFQMVDLLKVRNDAMNVWHEKLKNGGVIITDVTMVTSGIRKAACERMGIEVKCYLHDPRVAELAEKHKITRTQAGIRLAVEDHPDALYVFGNAPTALIELTALMRSKNFSPMGIVASPVGFVNVQESKHRVKSFAKLPAVIIEGRKGGSTLAATIVNSVLSLDDAKELTVGRDV